MECKNMQIMFLDEYYLLFVKYNTPSDIQKFANVEMFKMKNNTIIVIWF